MTERAESRVLIVGGGIGGLTTAIALAKNGMSATLLERSVFAEETGAGIQLGPNATRALASIGVLDAVEAVSFKPDLLRLFDGVSGDALASMPLGRMAEERYGAPYLTFHRADLHASLLARCRAANTIELRDGFEVRPTAGRDLVADLEALRQTEALQLAHVLFEFERLAA